MKVFSSNTFIEHVLRRCVFLFIQKFHFEVGGLYQCYFLGCNIVLHIVMQDVITLEENEAKV